MLAASMLLASCTNELSYDYEGDSSYNHEEVDVTFEITGNDLGISTRDGGGTGAMQTIGKGAEIDLLIYAVYLQTDEKDEAGTITGQTYSLLTQYGHDYVGSITDENPDPHSNINWDNACSHIDNNTPALKGAFNADRSLVDARNGQSIIHLVKYGTSQEDFDGFFNKYGVVKLSLRVKKNEKYVFVFWAQSSQTDAYDTGTPLLDAFGNVIKDENGVIEKDPLRKITVKYDGALANDEKRDAFCKADYLSVGSQQLLSSRTVKLTRPLAQINVGTTGADYKKLLSGDATYTNKEYKYSHIRLTGVANQIDLLTNQISVVKPETTAQLTATFGWSKMPAFRHLDLEELEKETDYDKYLETLLGDDKNDSNEEFLYVDLDSKGGYQKYLTDFPTFDENQFLTEKFKYLSMCYVLVPAARLSSSTDANEDYSSSVLEKIEIGFAESEDGFNFVKDSNGHNSKDKESAEVGFYDLIGNVKVQRNWRTNIIGGLGTENSSNSIFYSISVKPSLVTAFDENDSDENPTVIWGSK